MGALRIDVRLAADTGASLSNISSIYIWREEGQPQPEKDAHDVEYTYMAARVPPSLIEYDTIEERTYSGKVFYIKGTANHPIVTFKHKYSDGAEICLARAILALEEAGMNV